MIKFKIIIVLLFLSNIFLAYTIFNLKSDISSLKNQPGPSYNLLSPEIAWLDAEDFLEKQSRIKVSYRDLKKKIDPITKNSNLKGEYGIYFEDLTTGGWVGINEKEKFIPISLLKVPLSISILKKVNNDNLSLNQKITIEQEDIDLLSGSLGKNGAGYTVSLKEMLETMLRDSDNTALRTFSRRYITTEETIEAFQELGLPRPINETIAITPKEYSTMLKTLYFSSYLSRELSQTSLSMLANTRIEGYITSGVPAHVKVAHKIGYETIANYYHDCGIIYYPNRPYILCIMSKNSPEDEVKSVMKEISKTIYGHIESIDKKD